MLRALDCYCGAGGATRGLQLAGFHVTGIDIKAQPRYVGDAFIQADATNPPLDLRDFDFIWASPPCQHHTAMKTMHNAKPHLDLIPQTRDLLRWYGRPYCIENVEGAPLINPTRLCGTMFGLGVDGVELRRHRIFETSFPMPQLRCNHDRGNAVIGIYGGHVRNRRRRVGSASRGVADFSVEDGHAAMQIDWMTLKELSESIPPAFSHFVAKAWLASRAIHSEAAE